MFPLTPAECRFGTPRPNAVTGPKRARPGGLDESLHILLVQLGPLTSLGAAIEIILGRAGGPSRSSAAQKGHGMES